jgi:hypothetical protein
MKQITTKSGITGYQCRLQDNYSSFEEFEGYNETFNLTSRLGFSSAFKAWSANPTIQGSTNPEDFCVVSPEPSPIGEEVEGFTPGEVVSIKFELKSFSWADGLYIVLKVDENTLWGCRLEENGQPQKFDDGRYMSMCTGVNNKGITKTRLYYKLEPGYSHN